MKGVEFYLKKRTCKKYSKSTEFYLNVRIKSTWKVLNFT